MHTRYNRLKDLEKSTVIYTHVAPLGKPDCYITPISTHMSPLMKFEYLIG